MATALATDIVSMAVNEVVKSISTAKPSIQNELIGANIDFNAFSIHLQFKITIPINKKVYAPEIPIQGDWDVDIYTPSYDENLVDVDNKILKKTKNGKSIITKRLKKYSSVEYFMNLRKEIIEIEVKDYFMGYPSICPEIEDDDLLYEVVLTLIKYTNVKNVSLRNVPMSFKIPLEMLIGDIFPKWLIILLRKSRKMINELKESEKFSKTSDFYNAQKLFYEKTGYSIWNYEIFLRELSNTMHNHLKAYFRKFFEIDYSGNPPSPSISTFHDETTHTTFSNLKLEMAFSIITKAHFIKSQHSVIEYKIRFHKEIFVHEIKKVVKKFISNNKPLPHQSIPKLPKKNNDSKPKYGQI